MVRCLTKTSGRKNDRNRHCSAGFRMLWIDFLRKNDYTFQEKAEIEKKE